MLPPLSIVDCVVEPKLEDGVQEVAKNRRGLGTKGLFTYGMSLQLEHPIPSFIPSPRQFACSKEDEQEGETDQVVPLGQSVSAVRLQACPGDGADEEMIRGVRKPTSGPMFRAPWSSKHEVDQVQLRLLDGVHDDVIGLDVTMYQPCLMQNLDCVQLPVSESGHWFRVLLTCHD